MDINMLEITSKNCYKCDLETIIDNNSQYFWINLRDFEVETESKWLNIFNKHGNKSTLKYRRELTPDIKLQADRIFERNDLFEQAFKSCKATNAEFTMLKEKLGICLYEENYYEEEIIKIEDKEPIKEIVKVSTKKSTKKSTKALIDESDNESIEKINKESKKDFIEDLKEAADLNNKSTTNWYDKNKFNKILTTIDSNNFNHKNKIGKLRFNDIDNLINDIKNNTISEANAKKKINELNEIKNVETKGKRLINSQETLLSLFGDLKAIFNNNNNSNNIESDSNNENENENENENVNENENENENERDDGQYYLEQLNNNFKEIDETKSFKDQIDILKEIPDLNDYWYIEYYEDNKDINFRLFQLKLAHILNDVDDNLFTKIFGLTSVELVGKLKNKTSKEENQMLIDLIETNKDRIYEQEYSKFVIQPTHKRGDLVDTVKVTLDFNKTIQPYLT